VPGTRPTIAAWGLDARHKNKAKLRLTPAITPGSTPKVSVTKIVAIIAAVFGFGGVASAAAGIAKVLFFIFLVVFLVALVLGLMGGRRGI
jgi:uncharacterized membrane protein YtjA (UPF0391 family)